jgi:DNA-binding response OmpR family regulator
MARILVVEDEQKVASLLRRGLEQAKHTVEVAADGEQAIQSAENNEYDLVILDLMLPKQSGLEVLAAIRRRSGSLPVLILTAKSAVKDRVRGLEAGGDDYLVKPFAFAELMARVRALLRRGARETMNELHVDDLVLDPIRHKVTRAEKEIELSKKEYLLLEYLMRNANQVVTRSMIAEYVWDESFDKFTNVIDVYISFLRNKVDSGFDRKLIHTVRGVGYALRGEMATAET